MSFSNTKMKTALLVIVSLANLVLGDITRTNPPSGACLCFNGNNVNIRSTACGSVIGSENRGKCYKYAGSKRICSMGHSYDFFQLNWGGKIGWVAGVYLDLAVASRCSTPSSPPGDRPSTEYGCLVTNSGKRVHETTSHTRYDCMDSRCGNTCPGGQCVAYVKCSCTRNGRSIPNTDCWRPGQRVVTSDGKCNRNIAPNTAIATFESSGKYYGHAAVFIRCEDDHNFSAYDQWCAKSVGYSKYHPGSHYYSTFSTITSPSCSDAPLLSCRVENPGSSKCEASSPGCRRKRFADILESLGKSAEGEE